MRMQPCCKKMLWFLAAIAVWFFPAGCKHSRRNQSPQELAEGYYWYEAVFLQKEEVEAAFRTVSDDYPSYEYVPDGFHVTTQYKPEQKHENLYGTTVTVHITGYLSGTVHDMEESLVSENEGFHVEVSSADRQMQSLLDSYDRNWHITGSYSGAAKYTGRLDFSDAIPIDLTIEGVFGLGDNTGKLILE